MSTKKLIFLNFNLFYFYVIISGEEWCELAELKDVRGVGTKGLEKLNKLGIYTIDDLVTHYPFRYDYLVGNVVSFILSVLWSFYWNNKYVFSDGKENRNILKSLLKTYASYGFTGFILTNVLSYVWIEIFGISKIIAPLINNLLCVPINFILNKFWAFGKK